MTVNNSYLVGLFSSSSSSSATNLFSALYPSTSSASSSSGSSNAAALSQAGATAASSYVPPTPPWNQGSAKTATLVENAINGQPFVNPNAAQLDVTDSTPSVNADYKKLFAVYQGLNTLSALVTQAQATDNGNIETSQIKSAFASGLSQISTYLQSNPFTNLNLVQGSVSSSQTSSVGTPQGSTNYVGDNIVSGSSATAAPAFAGDVQFSATIQKTKTQATTVNGVTTETSVPDGSPVTVNFNLADMGTQTRSLTNVVNYLNSQLAAAGVSTRFATQRTAGSTQTVSVGGQTVDLSTSPDQFALVVKGSPTENISFAAPATSDAVYVNQAVGAPDAATQQLVKYQTDTSTGTAAPAALAQPSATYVTNDEALQTAPPSGVNSVLASATGPDGSLYQVANVDAQTVSGQPIKGATDVALLKYDSAGHLLYTQTLGADANATGYGIAVSADGSQVAVVGSVTGGLLPTSVTSVTGGVNAGESTTGSTTPASFVSVFDAAGDPQWTQVTPSASGDQANAVTFGADGSVYVAGQTQSALLGAGGSQGGTDSYIQGFSPTGTQTFLKQYGTSGTDTPAGIAVVGNTLLVAGSENGDGVVRNYQLQSSGAPVLQATRDLGALGDGSIAGLAVNNGQVIVAGTTTNASLSAGTITAAAGTGSNAFVASLSTALTPTSTDALAYYPGQGQTKATAVSVVDGQIYIAGNTGPTIATTDKPPATSSTSTTPTPTYATNSQGYITGQGGFLAQIDPTTGTVGWSTTLNGVNGIVAPTSIAAATSGASVLDRLGLPSGAISQSASDLLTNATSVVAGDSFYVQTVAGASPTKITISPDETWTTLAAKIQTAANGFATTTVVPTASTKLTIKASGTINTVQLLAGPAGSDALSALGLQAGLIQPSTTSSSSSKAPLVYGINLPSDLDLNNATDIANASAQISASLSLLKSAYQGLVNANTPATPATPSGSSGTVPAYLSAQLANYQAGLARLG